MTLLGLCSLVIHVENGARYWTTLQIQDSPTQTHFPTYPAVLLILNPLCEWMAEPSIQNPWTEKLDISFNSSLPSSHQVQLYLLLLLLLRRFSRVWLCATPQRAAHQAPPSMGFSRQEYWSGLPFPTPGELSNPGIEPMSLASPASAGRFFTTVPSGKPLKCTLFILLLSGT